MLAIEGAIARSEVSRSRHAEGVGASVLAGTSLSMKGRGRGKGTLRAAATSAVTTSAIAAEMNFTSWFDIAVGVLRCAALGRRSLLAERYPENNSAMLHVFLGPAHHVALLQFWLVEH
jgi:hypothetical protein